MKNCRWKVLSAAAILAGAVGFIGPPAWAVDNANLFELEFDADADESGALNGDDWETLKIDETLTATITNLQDGIAESLWADTSGTAIAASYDPPTGGPDTKAGRPLTSPRPSPCRPTQVTASSGPSRSATELFSQ